MAHEENWLKIQDWIVNKMRSCDGGIMPVGKHDLPKRQEPELDYQFILESASRTMIRFKKPERLIRMIVRIIDEQVKVTHTAMLLNRAQTNSFILIDSKGTEGVKIPVGFIRLTFENPLIRFLNDRLNFKLSLAGVVDYKEILDLTQHPERYREGVPDTETLCMVLKQMDLLKASICIPLYYKKDLIGAFVLGRKLNNIKFSRQEVGFFTTLANDVTMAISNAQLIQDLQEKIFEVHRLYEREHSIFIHTAISLAAAIDARDPYTHGHTERVTKYSVSIGEELKDMPEATAYKNFEETLHVAALLHDVGKIGVPDNILNKESGLTAEEYEKVKEHSTTGAAILNPISELGTLAREVRGHHERFDSAGYPDGLGGEEIPFIARIIAVADTFDAVTSDRPYRKKMEPAKAVTIIEENSGTQFDPIVVSAFLLAYRKGKLNSAAE